jgi:hypothetical protein
MYTVGAGVSNAKVKINAIGDPPNFGKGGIKVPAIIDWSSGIRKNVSVTQHQTGGKGFMGGGQSQTVENISYDIDLGLTFAANGPYNLLRLYANADVLLDQTNTSLLLTGAYDPTAGADPNYDPEIPPDPMQNYVRSIDRQNAAIPYDGDGVGTGSVQGGGSNFAIYTGTATQDPDPTEEADIDSKFGAGSTTAHRGKARAVLSNFDLSKWGGIVPNMTAAWEHQTLQTLDDIYGSLCERVNVKAATSDYDFTGISTIQSRGMLIAGRLFSPAEVMGSPDIQTVYNYFVTEAEGQIVGFIEGAEPSVTIADTEIGWMDSDGDVADILPEVDTVIASEIGLAREVHVKYIDLDKEWEPNTQSDNRQITEGVSIDVMEVQLALLSSEARTAAQRKLYRDYVAGSVHKFTLPWTYLYLYPGYKITITRAEGFSHVLKLTSISGGLGILECEGVAIEPAAFTQPSVVSISPGFPPNQPVPAMTILTLLDTPLLRDGDETNNNGVGFYACGTPRTGVDQTWVGFVLYRSRNSVWGLIGDSNLPGTIGTIVSVSGETGIITPINIGAGGSFTGNVFTKLAVSAAWDTGFFSSNSITGDGYIQWTATESNKNRIVGLSAADTDEGFTTVQYGWYMTGSATCDIYESNALAFAAGAYVASTTVFKIERIGTTLTYYKNGVSQRTVTVATVPFHVDVSVYDNLGTVGPVTMGQAGLAISSDPTVFDRGSIITVDLYGTSASLSSVTELDLLMDATKNLGLFGDMVGQFATATQVAGSPNRWSLSVLLNGRRGTESHVTDSFAGKRFVLIDNAVKFVAAQVTDINNNLTYRAVSSGQSLADAATVEFAWTGTPLRPLSPAHVTGTRNAANDLLVRWVRRTRISQGLRDFSDVPLVEEFERYKLEWYLATVLKATYYVQFLAAFTPFLLTRQDLDAGGGTGAFIRFVTQQTLDPRESYFEATLDLTGAPSSPPNVSIYRGDLVGVTSPSDLSVVYTGTTLITVNLDSTFGLSVTETGGSYSQGVPYLEDFGRIRIAILDGRFHVYLNPTGVDDAPLYVSQRDLLVENDLRGVLFMDEFSLVKVRNGKQPFFLYTATQQTADGFTPGNLLKLRISQVSAVVGAGPYAEVTI